MNKYTITENDITYSVEEYSNGSKFWYLNNQRHRVNGPARDCANGYKAWYLNGKRYNSNGPAIECTDGSKYWYYHGTYINCNNLKELNRQIKLLSIS